MAQTGPNTTIYVTNINFQTSTQALGDEFNKLGTVTNARIITTRSYNGKEYSQGFGFVTFKDPEVMKLAITKSGNIILDGRKLFIREARPRRRDTLFVRHIPAGSTPQELKALFAAYNPSDAKIVKFDTDQYAGFGFVKFDLEENRAKALENSRNLNFKGVNVDVRIAKRPFNLKKRRFNYFRGTRRAQRAGRQSPAPTNQVPTNQ